MQRILQINIAGRVLPIEEDAYVVLKNYIASLERQFTGADGREIIEDIEGRISELFSIRLQSGAPAINHADVQKVMDTLGMPGDINDGGAANASPGYTGKSTYSGASSHSRYQPGMGRPRLYRNPFDKMVGGVCSGLAWYFDVDTVIVRLIMLVLILTGGIGLPVYIIAWCVIPAARSEAELVAGHPVTFSDISSNVADELQDLKLRGEQMSRELKDFFSKKY